ncbi:MAG: hypothetical protein AAF533_23885 [Acidobacteriota bacterium]
MTSLLVALLSTALVTSEPAHWLSPVSEPAPVSWSCRHRAPYSGVLPAGTRLIDRFGHPWKPVARPERIQASEPGDARAPGLPQPDVGTFASTCNVPLTCASGFVVEFEDVLLGTGQGFDDCDPVGGGTLGEQRMETACAVLDYVASVIDLGPATPDIIARSSLNDPSGSVIAFASASYLNGLGTGFHGGNLRDHVVTGIDPTPLAGEHDAEVTVNFGITMHSDHAVSSGTGVDLFSVLLHELSHALGFASAIGPTGAGQLTGGGYTLFDEFLRSSTPSGPVLTNGTTYLGGPGALTSNDVWYFETANVEDQPVYSPLSWQQGSSLSHFDHDRATAASSAPQPFVMRPSYSGGDLRSWTPQEIEVWCDLGYSLVGSCTTSHPLGVDDVDMTTQGTPVTVDVIANDIGGVAIDVGSVVAPVPTIGAIVMSGTDITFTPDPGFCGVATILYSPVGPTGLVGTVASLTITVSCDFCPEDPCNFVCNGDFEGAPSPCAVQYDFNTVGLGQVPNWISPGGGADIYSRQYMAWDPNPCDTPWSCTMTSGLVGFGIPESFYSCINNGFDTWNGAGSGNDHYMGMRYARNILGPYSEGITAPLVKPLVPGQPYELCLRALNSVVQNLPGSPGALHVALNTTNPGVGSFTANMPGVQVFSLPFSGFDTWEQLTLPFVANAAHEFVTIEPEILSGGGHYSYYVFADDVRLVQDLPQLQVSKTVNDPTPELGDTIFYWIQTCNLGKNDVFGVQLQDVLPAGLSHVSGLSAYPDHQISFLPAGACNTVVLTALVEPTAPVNTPIDNCVSIVSPHADCAQPDSCATIEVVATDIAVTKNATPVNPPPGGTTTFEITVTNLGPKHATTVQVSDQLGPCFAHVSHSVTPATGTYTPATGLLVLPSLAVGQTVQLDIVAQALCTCAENCAELVGVNPPDFNPLNDRACVDVSTADVVIDGSVTPALASTVGPIPPGSTVFITGTFVHDLFASTYLIDGCQVFLDTNARIELPAGPRTLVVSDSTLQACNDMWDGIHVWSNEVGLLVANDSLLQDARNAIVSHAGGSFEVRNSTLDRNHVHVLVTPHAGTLNASIRGSVLSCTDPLIAPHAGEQTAVGVDVEQVDYLRVGENIAGATNTFVDLEVGIRSRQTNLEVVNNVFVAIQPELAGGAPVPGTGVAVLAEGVSGGPGGAFELVVGGPPPFTLSNTFKDCHRGIDASVQLDATISHNTFLDTEREAVRIHSQRESELVVDSNHFHGFGVGVALEAFRDCRADVFVNDIVDATGVAVLGVLVDDVRRVVSATASTNVWRNAFQGWGDLTHVRSSDHVSVSNNEMVLTAGVTAAARGVHVVDCEEVVVNSNSVTALGVSQVPGVQAIHAAQSPRTRITCNDIVGAGVHVHAQGPAMAASTIRRNHFTTGLAGYLLSMKGFTGPQGGPGDPSDNAWQTPFTFADTVSLISDGSQSPFLVRQGSPPHQPTVNVALFGVPIPIGITPPPYVPGNPCQSVAFKIGTGDLPALHVIAASELGSPEEEPALWEADRYFFDTVTLAPELLEDRELAAHHARLLRTNVAVVVELLALLRRGETGAAADLLQTMTPRGTIEGNYWDVLEATLARLGHPVARGRSEEERLAVLSDMAAQCIVDGGRAVAMARSELARRDVSVIHGEEDPCGVVQAMGGEGGRGRGRVVPEARDARPRRTE